MTSKGPFQHKAFYDSTIVRALLLSEMDRAVTPHEAVQAMPRHGHTCSRPPAISARTQLCLQQEGKKTGED